MFCTLVSVCFFFFKQKTAYEMRISDWSSDVCSSDLLPISSPLRNAYIDFSKMTASVVAVVTDVVRDGKPVVGYGFNSNGRYAASGLLRERFLPRLKQADPASFIHEHDHTLDPRRI